YASPGRTFVVAVVVVAMTGRLSVQRVDVLVHVNLHRRPVGSGDGHAVDNTALAGLLIDLVRGAGGHCLRGGRARLICIGPEADAAAILRCAGTPGRSTASSCRRPCRTCFLSRPTSCGSRWSEWGAAPRRRRAPPPWPASASVPCCPLR